MPKMSAVRCMAGSLWLAPAGARSSGVGGARRWADSRIEETLRFDTAFLGQALLPQPKFVLEPSDHPVAPVDLHLEAVRSRHGSRVWRGGGGSPPVFSG